MEKWIPLIAVTITTVVNVLLAFNAYLSRRDSDESKLATDMAVSSAVVLEDRRHKDAKMAELDSEVRKVRARLHDLADRKFGEVMTRIVSLERTEQHHFDEHERKIALLEISRRGEPT